MTLASSNLQGFDYVAHEKERCQQHNETPGSLQGYDCPVCMNRGEVSYVDDRGAWSTWICDCVEVRKSTRYISESGLAGALETQSFETFHAHAPWQNDLLSNAKAFVEAVARGGNEWLFIGGQPGCGKTHICTAVCGVLMAACKSLRYMVWTDASARIKAARNDMGASDELLEPLKQTDVLYIDDLFKGVGVRDGRLNVTDADVRLCFEIINARYLQGKTTIISSEWFLTTDLMKVDQATFSRVYQMTKNYRYEIGMDKQKNYRFSGN